MTIEKAKNLVDAYDLCDPVQPLQGEALRQFYLPLLDVRKTEAIEQLGQILRQQKPEKFSTILFTGHRGCGKTTELFRLQEQWQADYLTVYVDISNELDVNDLEYVDIYLTVIEQLEAALRKLEISFHPQLLQNFESWFRDITKETEETVNFSFSADAEAGLQGDVPFLAKLLFKLKAQIKNGSSQKTIIREKLVREVSRMKSDINLLLVDGLKKLRQKQPQYKGFLVILDNLDRCPIEVSEPLFFDHATQLQGLFCTIIYTVPISILYSPRGLSNALGNPHVMPMVSVYQPNLSQYPLDYDRPGLEAMAAIVAKRVEVAEVFNSQDELMELAQASGGHARQLMQLMQSVCLTASGRKHDKIMAEDVEYAIKQLQFSFERSTPRKYFAELADIAMNKHVEDDAVGKQMLFSTAVLEYNGTEKWHYPNPLIARSRLFQEAIDALRSP